jgi:hypothetical protein
MIACFGIAGCTAVQRTDSAAPKQLVTWEPVSGRTCYVSFHYVPSPSALLITSAIADSLSTRITSLSGRIVFSIVYGPRGFIRNEVISTTLSDTARAAVTRLVDAHLQKNVRGPDERMEHWGWQLGIDLSNAPRFTVGRQEICAAAEKPTLSSAVQGSASAGRPPGQPYTGRDQLRVLIRVDSNGAATVRVLSGSSSGAFDAVASSIIAARPYWPKLIDRIPVESEFEDWFP